MNNTAGQWRLLDENAPVLIGRRYRMELTIRSHSVGAQLQDIVNRAIHNAFTELGNQARDAEFDVVEVSAPSRVPGTLPPAHTVYVVFHVRARPPIGGGPVGRVGDTVLVTVALPGILAGLTFKKVVKAIAVALIAFAAVVTGWRILVGQDDLWRAIRTGVWILLLGGCFILLYPGIVRAVRSGRGADTA